MCESRTQQTSAYPVRRVEPATNIPYFVKRDFEGSPTQIRNIEIEVLSSYYTNYQYLCASDIQREKRVALGFFRNV